MSSGTMLPEQYYYIAAWGRMLGSQQGYIKEQQQRAAEDNAPADALYKRDDGTWRCRHHLVDTRQNVIQMLDRDAGRQGVE